MTRIQQRRARRPCATNASGDAGPGAVVAAAGIVVHRRRMLVRSAQRLGFALLIIPSLSVGVASSVSAAPASKRVQLDRIVAVVGDAIVLESELGKATDRHPLLAEAMSQVPANAPPELVEQKRREVEAKVLDELIDLALFRAEAVKFDIRVTEEDVDRAMVDVARQYGMTVEQLRQQVESSDEYGSWAEYREELRDQIIQLKVPHYLATWSVSEAQIREHYRKLTKDESAKVQVVQFTFTPSSQNSADRDKSFAKAQALAARLRGGEDARKLVESGEETAAERTIGRGDIAPTLEDALFAAKPDQVVGPLASGQGYVVFEVIEQLESGALSYEEAKPRIREQLESEAFFNAQTDLREQLRAKAHIDIRL